MPWRQFAIRSAERTTDPADAIRHYQWADEVSRWTYYGPARQEIQELREEARRLATDGKRTEAIAAYKKLVALKDE